MGENIKVIVRCRPLNEREKALKCKNIVKIDSKVCSCSITNPDPAETKSKPKVFSFDGAYGVESTTENIYSDLVFSLVESVTEGYHGTIFAYGQTGSGKTHTMQGYSENEKQRGIIPRSFDHVFETIAISEDTKFLVHVSFLEIYMEAIQDLLVDEKERTKLELKENPELGVYVKDLKLVQCRSMADCIKVMSLGWSQRQVAATKMNEYSSRSHAIFTLHLERIVTDSNQQQHIRVAKLNLVDLAGSERQSKAGSAGERLKEAAKINLSLSALGNVISALADGKSTHIPYRDSKLTRLLQMSLGGNAKTLMVACLSPADNNYDETLSTLRYANRAKNIKNKPKINEDPNEAMLRECLQEIERLKAQLRGEAAPQTIIVEKQVFVTDEAAMAAEIARLQAEKDAELARMRAEYEAAQKKDKAQMAEDMARLQADYEHKIVSAQAAPSKTSTAAVDKPKKVADKLEEGLDGLASVSSAEGMTIQRPEDIKQRLQELEGQMVGGEQAHNKDIKLRRTSRIKHVEARKKELREALAKKDGDDIMVDVYESIQHELSAKGKQLDAQRAANEALQQEVHDLQVEFQKEREDFTDIIRKLNQDLMWRQGVIDRMLPIMRLDCNYRNLDAIREQSRWDDDAQTWDMPKMNTEKIRLPQAAGPKSLSQKPFEFAERSLESRLEEAQADERLQTHLLESANQKAANEYFQNKKRANQLLSSVESDRNRRMSMPVAPPNKTLLGPVQPIPEPTRPAPGKLNKLAPVIDTRRMMKSTVKPPANQMQALGLATANQTVASKPATTDQGQRARHQSEPAQPIRGLLSSLAPAPVNRPLSQRRESATSTRRDTKNSKK